MSVFKRIYMRSEKTTNMGLCLIAYYLLNTILMKHCLHIR